MLFVNTDEEIHHMVHSRKTAPRYNHMQKKCLTERLLGTGSWQPGSGGSLEKLG